MSGSWKTANAAMMMADIQTLYDSLVTIGYESRPTTILLGPMKRGNPFPCARQCVTSYAVLSRFA